MMRPTMLLALALLLPATAQAQDQARRQNVVPGTGPERARLEQQIVQRFVQQAATAMRLEDDRRDRLEALLNEGNARRRSLGAEALRLRRRLQLALQDAGTPDAEFERILAGLDQLRDEEHRIWMDEQRSLVELFSPRERAQFTVQWIRFQQRIKEMLARRGGDPPDSMPR